LETMWKSIHAVSLIVKLMVTRCLVHNSPCMGADAREARVEHTRSTYLVGRPNAIAAGTRSSLGIGWRRAGRYCSCVGNNGVWQVARSSWGPTSWTGERSIDALQTLRRACTSYYVLAGRKTWTTLLEVAGTGCSEGMAAMR
jgi:hypothetical protein